MSYLKSTTQLVASRFEPLPLLVARGRLSLGILQRRLRELERILGRVVVQPLLRELFHNHLFALLGLYEQGRAPLGEFMHLLEELLVEGGGHLDRLVLERHVRRRARALELVLEETRRRLGVRPSRLGVRVRMLLRELARAAEEVVEDLAHGCFELCAIVYLQERRRALLVGERRAACCGDELLERAGCVLERLLESLVGRHREHILVTHLIIIETAQAGHAVDRLPAPCRLHAATAGP